MTDTATALVHGRLEPEAAGARVAGLYERHGRAVYGLCRLLLNDKDEAEDATQATFLAAHGALTRGGEPRDAGAWLSAIARNECRGRIRERMRTPVAAGEEALTEIAAPDGDPARRVTDPVVTKALAALPERQREAVVLHDVFGLRAREVATTLGLSLPAAEALLFRARRQLRLRLRPVAGALSLPVGIRDALVQAIPGFSDGSAAAGAAAAGAAGAGVLAKLVAAPAAAKVAAATVAVTAAGSVAVVEVERGSADRTLVSVVRTADDSGPSGGRRGASAREEGRRGDGHADGRSGRSGDRDDEHKGRGGDSDDGRGDSSGPGPSGIAQTEREGDDHERSKTSSSGHGSGTDDAADTDAAGPASGSSSSGQSGGGDRDADTEEGGETTSSGPGSGDRATASDSGPGSDDPVATSDSGSGGDGGGDGEKSGSSGSGSGTDDLPDD